MRRVIWLVALAAILTLGTGNASAHHEKTIPTKISTIERIYPDLHARVLRERPVSWQRLRVMAADRWQRTHPAADRVHQRKALNAEIERLVRESNKFPTGIDPTTGRRYVNGYNYALFDLVLDGEDVGCARYISGRETGGTYDHRYVFGFDVPAFMGAVNLAGGIGQALPPTKMLPWQRSGISIYRDPVGQIRWMKAYAEGRPGMGSLCAAADYHRRNGVW